MIKAIESVLFPVLDFLYALTHSWGWSIVLFAGVAKVALIPLTNNQFKSMKEMQALQPEISRLQKKHKDNPQVFHKEFSALMRSRKVNPFAGCFFSMIVQLPVLWALYYVIRDHIDKFARTGFLWIGPFAEKLVSFFPSLANRLYDFKGVCDISVTGHPSFPYLATSLAGTDWILLVLYGLSMIFYSQISSMPNMDKEQVQTQKTMNMVMPVMSVIIFSHFPSAFILYWLVFNVFSIIHQRLYYRFYQTEPLPVSGTKRGKATNA